MGILFLIYIIIGFCYANYIKLSEKDMDDGSCFIVGLIWILIFMAFIFVSPALIIEKFRSKKRYQRWTE